MSRQEGEADRWDEPIRLPENLLGIGVFITVLVFLWIQAPLIPEPHRFLFFPFGFVVAAVALGVLILNLILILKYPELTEREAP